jgi:hypothetical protein
MLLQGIYKEPLKSSLITKQQFNDSSLYSLYTFPICAPILGGSTLFLKKKNDFRSQIRNQIFKQTSRHISCNY